MIFGSFLTASSVQTGDCLCSAFIDPTASVKSIQDALSPQLRRLISEKRPGPGGCEVDLRVQKRVALRNVLKVLRLAWNLQRACRQLVWLLKVKLTRKFSGLCRTRRGHFEEHDVLLEVEICRNYVLKGLKCMQEICLLL